MMSTPVNIKINEETNVVQSFYDEKWNDLVGNLPRVSEALANSFSFIKPKYRDHSDHLNGSMNFVSPLYKYFGWYVPEVLHTSIKSDDAAPSKRFYSPDVIRWIGDESLSIETISDTTDATIGEGSRRAYPYIAEANFVEDSLLAQGMTWKHNISGKDITYPINSEYIFENTKIISSGMFHRNDLDIGLNEMQDVDIVGVQVDWRYLPKGSYLRFSVIKHKVVPTTFRLLVKHDNSTSSKQNGNLFGGWASEIRTLDQYDAARNRYYYEGMDIEGKIERPEGANFTTIMLESRGNDYDNETMQGFLFNVFIPEEYYYECTRGLNQTEFLWIKDISKLEQTKDLLNALDEHAYIPSFPRAGDTLKVIESLDTDPDSPHVQYKEYLCTAGMTWGWEKYINRYYYHPLDPLACSYPVTKDIHPNFLEYYLSINGKKDGDIKRYKALEPYTKPPKLKVRKDPNQLYYGELSSVSDDLLKRQEIADYTTLNKGLISLSKIADVIGQSEYAFYNDYRQSLIDIGREYGRMHNKVLPLSDTNGNLTFRKDGDFSVYIPSEGAYRYPHLVKELDYLLKGYKNTIPEVQTIDTLYLPVEGNHVTLNTDSHKLLLEYNQGKSPDQFESIVDFQVYSTEAMFLKVIDDTYCNSYMGPDSVKERYFYVILFKRKPKV